MDFISRSTCEMQFVVEQLATRGVGQLEPLETALFVTREHPDASVEDRARELTPSNHTSIFRRPFSR